MTLKKGFKKIVSFALAGAMALGLAVTGGGGNVLQVEAAEMTNQDSVSAVNYAAILGGAIDYGIVCNKLTQIDHLETTYAVNQYSGLNKNTDVDYSNKTAHFIIGSLDDDSNITFGKTEASSLYVEAPSAIYEGFNEAGPYSGSNGNFNFADGFQTEGHHPAIIKVQNENASDNVARIMNRIKGKTGDIGWSEKLADKAKDDTYALPASYINKNGGKVTINIDDDLFENKVVYINADNDIIKALKQNGGIEINKRSSTVVVFNIEDKDENGNDIIKEEDLVTSEKNATPHVLAQKFIVNTENHSLTSTTNPKGSKEPGYDHDDPTATYVDDDREICQKIVWNFRTEKSISLDGFAGVILAPNSSKVVVENNSAGWIVTSGDVETRGEFHYVFQGGSDDIKGQMHFALKKGLTSKYDTKVKFDAGTTKPITSIGINNGEYEFNLQEYTDSTFTNPLSGGTSLSGPVGTDSTVAFDSIDYNGKVAKPVASDTSSYTSSRTVGEGESAVTTYYNTKTFYYVITENQNPTNKVDGVEYSTGDIKITVEVTRDSDDHFTYKVGYITENGDGTVYNDTNGIKEMAGVQYDLGSFYNKVSASLYVEKKVTGDYTPLTTDEYQIKLKNSETGKYYKVDGDEATTDAEKIVTIKAGEKVAFSNLPAGKYIAEEVKDTAEKEGFDLEIKTSGEASVVAGTNTIPTITITNDYSAVGKLTVKKTVTGDYADAASKTYTFKVKCTSGANAGKYLKSDNSFDIAGDSFNVKVGEDKKFVNLPAGTYKVEEEKPEYDETKYEWSSSVSGDATIAENDKDEHEVTIENKFEDKTKAKLSITKTMSGASFTNPDDYNNQFELKISFVDNNTTYYIQNDNGVYKAVAATGWEPTIRVSAGKPIEITGDFIKAGTGYTITESNPSAKIYSYNCTDGKDHTYKSTKISDGTNVITGLSSTVTIPSEGSPVANVVVTNTYDGDEETGTLKLKKTFTGDSFTLTETEKKNLSFEVTGPEGFTTTRVTYDQFTNGEYSLGTVPTGTYSVTETGYDGLKSGYTFVTEGSTTSVTNKTLSADGTLILELTNKYTKDEETGTLKLKKTFTGDSFTLTETEKKNLSFEVTGPEGFTTTRVTYDQFTNGEYSLGTVPTGTYSVTETGYDGLKSGYTFVTEGSTTSVTNKTLSADGTLILELTNKYTKDEETGTLKLKKTFTGDSFTLTETEKKNLSFEVTGPEGFTTTRVTYDQFTNGEYSLGTVPTGTYSVTETGYDGLKSGYTFVTEGSTTSVTNKTLSADGTLILELTNKYTKDEETGTLKLKKTFTGDSFTLTETEKKNLSFEVTGPEGFTTTRVTYDQFTNGEYSLGTVPTGTYSVTETGYDGLKSGYTFVTEGSTTSVTNKTLSADGTLILELTNKYTKDEETGTLKLKKTFTGDSFTLTETEKKNLSFEVTGPEGFTTTRVTYDQFTNGEYSLGTVPTGTYSVTETGYDGLKSGYTFVTEGSTTSVTNKTLSADGTLILELTNKYTKDEETGTLKLKKTFTGDSFTLTETEKKNLSFEVTGPEGFTTTRVTYDQFTNGEYSLGTVPTGTYSVTETGYDGLKSGYTFVTEGSTTSVTNKTLSADGTLILELTNKYTKDEETGTLKLKKTFTGDSFTLTETEKKNLSFEVTGPEGFTTTRVTYDQFTNGEYSLGTVPTGTYSVTETGYDGLKSGYTFVTEGSTTSVTNKTLSADGTLILELTNNYKNTQPGKLVISKQITGAALADIGTITFEISPAIDGNGGTTTVTLDKDNLTGWNTDSEPYTYTIDGLVAGNKYTVTERGNGSNDAYNCTSEQTSSGELTIPAGSAVTAAFTNQYTAKPTTGSLRITKNVTVSENGGTASSTTTNVVDGTYYFTITNKDNPSLQKNAEITITNGESKSAVVEGLNAGTYIVSEDTTRMPEGVTLPPNENNIEVVVVAGSTETDCNTATFTNNKNITTDTPTPKATIKITKTISGPITDEDKKGLTFEVYKVDGGTESLVGKYVLGEGDGNDFTNNNGVYEKTITVDAAETETVTYKIVETLYTFNNTTVSVTNTVKANDGTETSNASDTAEVSLSKDDNVTVAFDNAYTNRTKKVNLTKYDLPGTKYIDGAIMAIYSIDADGNQVSAADGGIYQEWESSTTNVYEFTLEPGDYAIKEIKAPEGYQGTEDIFKFNLSFDSSGNGIIKSLDNSLAGTYNSADNAIRFYNDPIVVTGELYVHVTVETPNDTEGKNTKDVPGLEVTVTDKKTGNVIGVYTTNEKGEVVDSTGKYPKVPAGDYHVKITKVPDNYTFKKKLDGQESDVKVPENGQGRHEAVIETLLGGLDIIVIEETTGRVVPGAKVLVTKPDGTTEECVTDKNGMITKFAQKDEFGNYTSPLGKYTYKVTWVPDGYKVTLNEENEGVVEAGKLTSLESRIDTKTTTPTKTTNTTTTTTSAAKSVDTGDHTNVIPFIILMIVSLISSIVVIIRKRRLRYEY